MGYIERFILGKNNEETREFEKVLNIIEEAECGELVWHRLLVLKQDWEFEYYGLQIVEMAGKKVDFASTGAAEIYGSTTQGVKTIVLRKTFSLKKGTELIWVAGARMGLYCEELPEALEKLEQAEILRLSCMENIDSLINDNNFMEMILTEDEILRKDFINNVGQQLKDFTGTTFEKSEQEIFEYWMDEFHISKQEIELLRKEKRYSIDAFRKIDFGESEIKVSLLVNLADNKLSEYLFPIYKINSRGSIAEIYNTIHLNLVLERNFAQELELEYKSNSNDGVNQYLQQIEIGYEYMEFAVRWKN